VDRRALSIELIVRWRTAAGEEFLRWSHEACCAGQAN